METHAGTGKKTYSRFFGLGIRWKKVYKDRVTDRDCVAS